MQPSLAQTTPPHTPIPGTLLGNESHHDPLSAHILGIGTAFPPDLLMPQDLENFATKWCEPSESLSKTLMVNNHTQIDHRPLVQKITDPLLNQPEPPKIRDVNKVFMDKGVELALTAAKKALSDWGGKLEDITHLVCNTCTASSYPGYDHALLMALGLPLTTDRTLLHGVGCAGGLSLVRLAHQLARVPVDPSPIAKPTRILVVSTEVTSTLCRSEIDELNKASKEPGGDKGWPNVSLCLFSDGASAMIVGAADGEGRLASHENSSFEIMDCITETVPDTVEDLGFNVDEYGWKAIISQRVPKLTSQAVPQLYNRLLSKPSIAIRAKASKSFSYLASSPSETQPSSLDWLIHPGGSLIIAKVEKQLGLVSEDHTRASWHVYQNKGNTSSVSIGAVVEQSRKVQSREGCIAVAFGPGVTVEMCLLRRTGWKGRAEEEDRPDIEEANGNGHDANDAEETTTWQNDNLTSASAMTESTTRAETYAGLGIHDEASSLLNGTSGKTQGLKRRPDSDLADLQQDTAKRAKTEGGESVDGSSDTRVL